MWNSELLKESLGVAKSSNLALPALLFLVDLTRVNRDLTGLEFHQSSFGELGDGSSPHGPKGEWNDNLRRGFVVLVSAQSLVRKYHARCWTLQFFANENMLPRLRKGLMVVMHCLWPLTIIDTHCWFAGCSEMPHSAHCILVPIFSESPLFAESET